MTCIEKEIENCCEHRKLNCEAQIVSSEIGNGVRVALIARSNLQRVRCKNEASNKKYIHVKQLKDQWRHNNETGD